MSYGIKVTSDDGYINLHSDYSSLVYGGEFTRIQDPVRPVYQGDYAIGISEYEKDAYYDMGYITQYTFTTAWPLSKIVPFYHPAFNGQEVAIMDIVNDGGNTWVVNLIFDGNASTPPRLFAFVDMKDVQNYLNVSGYGIVVYDQVSDIIFNNQVRPLRVDSVTLIEHPTNIKTTDRGACSNSTGAECHINFSSSTNNDFAGATGGSTKLYHIVPTTYGGLAYQSEGGYDRSCGFLGLGTRKYAWAYQSWASFRGTVRAFNGSSILRAGWKADFAGGAYQLASSSCGYSGILGALIGIIAVVLTGGAALAVIGGALAGFAVGSLTTPSTPSVKVYDQDETHDTNNPAAMMVTDASYYSVSVSQVATPSNITGSGSLNSGNGYVPPYDNPDDPDNTYGAPADGYEFDDVNQPYTYWLYDPGSGYSAISWFGDLVVNDYSHWGASNTTLPGDGYVYYRGDLMRASASPVSSGNQWYWYAVAREVDPNYNPGGGGTGTENFEYDSSTENATYWLINSLYNGTGYSAVYWRGTLMHGKMSRVGEGTSLTADVDGKVYLKGDYVGSNPDSTYGGTWDYYYVAQQGAGGGDTGGGDTGGGGGTSGPDYQYSDSDSSTNTFWLFNNLYNNNTGYTGLYWNGQLVYSAIDKAGAGSSITGTDGYTYLKGSFVRRIDDVSSGGTWDYYQIARAT